MQQTANFQLSQWASTDRIQMEDFNNDNAKIDAALKAEQTAREALAEAVAKCGNCEIGILEYTGTGTYGATNPTVITFPRKPAAFIIIGPDNTMHAACEGGYGVSVSPDPSTGTPYFVQLSLTWTGSTVSFSSSRNARVQMNYSGKHWILAFYQKDQA